MSFVAGAILVVLICLTVYDEDTLQIEHMLTVITICGVTVSTTRIFIPPEVGGYILLALSAYSLHLYYLSLSKDWDIYG